MDMRLFSANSTRTTYAFASKYPHMFSGILSRDCPKLFILVKLLCAHLCSDFFFQTDAINTGKRKPGIKGYCYQIQ